MLSRPGWRPSLAEPTGKPGAGVELMQAVEVSVRDPEQGGEGEEGRGSPRGKEAPRRMTAHVPGLPSSQQPFLPQAPWGP